MKDNIITLLDENEQPIEMEVVATLKVARKDYAILHDVVADQDLIFCVSGDGDEQSFSLVDDETERQDVIDAYYELID